MGDFVKIILLLTFTEPFVSPAQIHQWLSPLENSVQYGKGYTSMDKPLVTKSLYILSQCETQCLSLSQCVYLTFDTKGQTCKLFSVAPTKSSVTKAINSSVLLLKSEINQPQDFLFACSSSPCKNGGRCLEGSYENGTFFQCACTMEWKGNTCEIKVYQAKWADWEEWSPCSSQCGSGWKRRRRTCIRPDTQLAVGQWMCPGNDHEFATCSSGQCPKLEPWAEWSSCSSDIRCGEGEQTRNRSCSSSSDEKWPCRGPGQETRPCTSVQCNAPVKLSGDIYVYGTGRVEVYDHQTASWGAVCAEKWDKKITDVVCRQMGLVAPQEDKHSSEALDSNTQLIFQEVVCDGTEGALVQCLHAPLWSTGDCKNAAVVECEVNGGWGTWASWGDCNVSCDNGTKTRTRECDFPKPTPGGANCPGSNQHTEPCFVDCSGNGQWGEWLSWSNCSNTCGDGVKTRMRLCDNPPPAPGAVYCIGDDRQEETCNDQSRCSVDGTYEPWSDWGACSVTCGNGTQSRSRECTGIAFGGNPCQGPAEEIQDCFPVHCPVDGYYEAWEDWSDCSVSCGNGTQTRSRTCVQPKYGGADCVGEASQTQECFPIHCPVDGVYSRWSDWSSCSATCGPGGQQYRNRTCEGRAHGGKECDGLADEAKDCFVVVCPVDGKWSDWSDWSVCSHTCGDGTRAKNRTCEGRIGAGKPCEGDAMETEPCTTSCTKPGEWMAWGNWSRCSATCGGGERQRKRDCNMTTWGDLTDPCEGSAVDTTPCNKYSCTPLAKNCETWKQRGMEENAMAQIDIYGVVRMVIWVYCNVEDDDGYTEIRHNLMDEVKVEGYEARGSFSRKIVYNITDANRNALTSSASSCRQYLGWRCISSYMINPNADAAKDGLLARMTYFIDKSEKAMMYWPGGDPDTIGCACSVDNSCDGGAKWCNCDAGDEDEHIDEGFLEGKDNLPIKEVRAGDTGDPGEAGFLTVGPIQCKGVSTDLEFKELYFYDYLNED